MPVQRRSHRIDASDSSTSTVKRLRDALRKEGLCLTAELNLRGQTRPGPLLDQAGSLSRWVDAVQVSDVERFPAIALARLLLESGIDPVVQLAASEKTLTTIETELLGALSMGVTSFLLVRGARHAGKSHEQVSARQMIALANDLRQSHPGYDFRIGTSARLFKPIAGWQPTSLLEKTAAGADFIRTQPCFDAKQVAGYVSHLVGAQVTWQASLLVSIAVLPSARGAMWLKEHMKGARVPQSTVKRLEQAQDPELEGVQIAGELLHEVSQIPGVEGVCLMSPSREALIVEAIKASGLSKDDRP